MSVSSDLSRLIRAAARGGPSSRASLAVLQDALLERFPVAFADIVELAKSVDDKRSAERMVVFYPHAIGRGEQVARLPRGRSPITGDYPPFGVATAAQLEYEPSPAPSVIVWSSRTGLDTSKQQAMWRAAQRARVQREREQPAMVLDVERIRLDRGGYSTRDGTYYGVGQPVFRVTSRDPLPENEAGWIAPLNPHAYRTQGGIWVDSVLRAPRASEARRTVARALGIRPLTRPPRRT